MTRPTWRDVTFLAALPFVVIGHLCADYFARQDTKLADAINRAGVDDQ